MSRRALHILFVIEFRRSDITLYHLKHLCQRRGWKTGRTGFFAKGAPPMNKGKPCPPGKGGRHPNSRKTHFKPGTRSGVAVKLYKPIGTERFSKEGYVERKIHDGLPLQSRWRGVHLIRWEKLNGKVPKGHCLKSIDGNKANTDPENWKLIPRSMLPRLAGRWGTNYDTAPAELKPTIFAIAELESKARAIRKGKEH